MKNRINSLFNSTAPMFMSPPDELNGIGSFGGSDESGGGADQNQNGNGSGGQSPLIGVDDEDGESALDEDVFKMFNPEDGADDDEDDDASQLSGDVPAEQITAMQTEIQTSIKNMRLPDNIIPQDFDPSDRNQLQTLLTNVQQATIAQSLNVVFKPVQLALKHMKQQMDATIDSKVNSTKKGIQEQSIMEQIVPEVTNPKYAGMIKGMDAQLKANGKSVKERATTLRKMLNQMGINEGGGTGNNRRASNPNQGAGNQGMKTGKSALDSFFGPMPTPQK